jgi:nicotinate phosphoribosyltransferase
MTGGRRLQAGPSLADIRAVAARDLERLPKALQELAPGANYPVTVADALMRLAAEVDERIAKSESVP